MHTQNYVKIAQIFHDNLTAVVNGDDDDTTCEMIATLARDQAMYFVSENPHFSPKQFFEACGLTAAGEIE